MCVIYFFLILFHTSCGIYSIPKESNYTAAFLSINSKNQCVLLLFLSLRFMTYAPSFVLGKLYLEKTPLNLGSKLKCSVISILLKIWCGTKNVYACDPYYYILFLLLQHFFQSTYFPILKQLKLLITYQEIHLLILYSCFTVSINLFINTLEFSKSLILIIPSILILIMLSISSF